MNSRPALLIVDVQKDFCNGGALAVPDGDKVVKPLNQLIELFLNLKFPIFFSRDWHPRETKHFAEFGGKWPVHCVQNTPGAEFHPDLQVPENATIISKGYGTEDDGYSMFEGVKIRENDWPLSFRALSRNYKELFVGGLATDYCVRATVLDALKPKNGHNVFLVKDACRAVNREDGNKAVREMSMAGAMVVYSGSVIRDLSRKN